MKALVGTLLASLVLTAGCGPRRLSVDGKSTVEESPYRFADGQYAKGDFAGAESAYQDYIDRNESSKENKVQNRVTVARIRKAYTMARRKQYAAARENFIEASRKHRGKDRPSPDYGLLSDQALYQSIVCLAADGKKDQAIAEYKKFLVDKWDSPVCYAVIKRIHMLVPRKDWGAYDKLMESAVERQDARSSRESAVCGPKALAYLLESLGKGKHDYHKLSKLCGTSDQGTTMAGLQKGLANYDLKPVGVLLNRRDFPSVDTPALWLGNDHYYVLLKVSDSEAQVWDPKSEKVDSIPLPALDDAGFYARVLALNNPLKSKASS